MEFPQKEHPNIKQTTQSVLEDLTRQRFEDFRASPSF
ncbi:hypothetical protein LINPERHAP2_LOCUS17575 [Linum perenne]